MSNYEILSKEPISNTQVKSIISKKAKETEELTYREKKTKDYLKTYTKLKLSDFKKAREELLTLEIRRIEEKHIIKILDIMPKNGTELRAIVSHSGMVFVDESVEKILEVLKKYR